MAQRTMQNSTKKFFGHPIGDGIFDNIIVVGGGGFTVLRTLA